MDITDIPDDAYTGDESPPDFDELESPDSLLKGGSIRERLLDAARRDYPASGSTPGHIDARQLG